MTTPPHPMNDNSPHLSAALDAVSSMSPQKPPPMRNFTGRYLFGGLDAAFVASLAIAGTGIANQHHRERTAP